MARRVKDRALDSREARRKLAHRRKPYFRSIERGLHLGFRKLRSGAGTWVARYYVGSQSYLTERLGTADDLCDADGVAILDFWQAQKIARENMVRRAHRAAGKYGPLTVRAAIAAYLEVLDGALKSAADTKYKAEAFIYPKLGHILVEKLTTHDLRRWLSEMAKQPARIRTRSGDRQRHRAGQMDDEAVRRRRSTANRVLAILKAALNHAFWEGQTASDCAWRKLPPFKHVESARIRYLRVPEAQRLINACDDDFRILVQAALQTGARYGELTQVAVGDFNPASGTLQITKSKSGKGRHVVLTDEGTRLFTEWCAGRNSSDLLLRKADGHHWRASHQARPMKQACQRAKIEPPITFHGLRHTWASLAVMAQVPLLVVAKNLGHTDTRMVERHYGHLAPSYVADAIRAGAPRFATQPTNVRSIG